MRNVKRIIICVLVFLMCSTTAFAADYYTATQVMYKEEVEPCNPENASIIFSPIPQMNKMSFIDGQSEGRYAETYSEPAVWNDIPGRQVYVENYLYCSLDRNFASKDDHVFAIDIDYWDYGGGGYFHVEYTTNDKGAFSRASIYKLGHDENGQKTAGGWHRATLYIDDACFTGSMEYGADFRLVSNAYNTFSRIEIRNLSRTAGKDEDFGQFNLSKANSLNYLKMFDGYGEGEEFVPCLDKKLTREEFYTALVKSYALGDKAKEENRKSNFTDVSEEFAPYVAYAEKLGVITNSTDTLGAKDYLPQKEAVAAYLRLLGYKGDNLEENAMKLGRETGLLNGGCMIFQPERDVTVDNFVALAMNAFPKENVSTGESAFGKLFNEGVYTEETLFNANDIALSNWLLENEFKIEKREVTDPYSRRVYHEIDFFGNNAMKEYYTENCMSVEGDRIAFRDSNMHLYIYHIDTGDTTYIGDVLRDYNFMITPKNNLWYTSADWEIIKVDLDTEDYVQTVEGRIPEWQTRAPYMLQVNNAETRISYEWRDTKGDFDSNYVSRIPIYNLETDEWILDYYWGFKSEWYYPNHQCINPVYDNYAFFAHEGYHPNGTTQYDRVWVVNMDTNEYYNAIKQKAYQYDYDLLGPKYRDGENLSHEAWSNNGEWLIAVKNTNTRDGVSRGVGIAGAVLTRPDGSDKQYIPVKYEFTRRNGGSSGSGMCHTMMSNTSERWLVADSTYGNGFSDLYLVDCYTGKDYFLARLNETGKDPGHIHPQFSLDDTKVIFGHWADDNSHSEIGWMDVSDIVFGTPLTGGEYDLSENCDTFGYSGFDHYIIPDTDENGEIKGFRIPRNNKMNVNVKREVIESDNTPADITITYLDEGTTPLNLTYNTWDFDVGGFGKLTERSMFIERKNTGKIITKTIHFDDINLGNMFVLGTDFRISGASTEAYIVSVDVTIPEKNATEEERTDEE